MDPQQAPDSNFVHFARRLEFFPRYVVDYFFGLLAAVISDILTTSMVIAAVLLGLAIGHWLLAGAFFFTIYTFSRVINGLAGAIGSTGQILLSLQQQQPPSMPPMAMPPPMPPTGEPPAETPRIPVTLPPH